MKHVLFKTTLAALVLTVLTVAVSEALPPVSADDPLVSLSYLTGPYRDGLLSDVDVAVATAKKQITADFMAQTAALREIDLTPVSTARNDFEIMNLTAGQNTPLTAGGEVLLVSGEASASMAGLVDATEGKPVAKGTALLAHHLYVASADSAVQTDTSCQLLVK